MSEDTDRMIHDVCAAFAPHFSTHVEGQIAYTSGPTYSISVSNGSRGMLAYSEGRWFISGEARLFIRNALQKLAYDAAIRLGELEAEQQAAFALEVERNNAFVLEVMKVDN